MNFIVLGYIRKYCVEYMLLMKSRSTHDSKLSGCYWQFAELQLFKALAVSLINACSMPQDFLCWIPTNSVVVSLLLRTQICIFCYLHTLLRNNGSDCECKCAGSFTWMYRL